MKELYIVMSVLLLVGTVPNITVLNCKNISIEAVQNEQGEILSVKEINLIQGILSTRKTVEVRYTGKVTPPLTYYYSKTRGGKTYEGILDLESYAYSHKTNITTAIYVGDAYPID